MNKAQKEVEQAKLDSEKRTLSELKEIYEQAKADCDERIRQLSMRTDMENLQSIIYQKKYQEVIKGQLEDVLDKMNTNQYSTISSYLTDCYHNGFIGSMYDIRQQGIPITIPINQENVTRAIQIDSKLSAPLYTRLGEDVGKLKDEVRKEVSRGIASGKSWNETAIDISRHMKNTPFDKAMNNSIRIARTEGHRISSESSLDAMKEAKKKGANVVKQWDAALDARTRDTHAKLDGQIREIDEDFEVDGMKAQAPGMFGIASEDCNCRCVATQRARWALDEEELEELKKRAEYFELDKTESFEEFKEKYLDITDEKNYQANMEKYIDNSVKNNIIKSLDIDDFELMAGGKEIDPEVIDAISSVISRYEKTGNVYINDFYFGSLPKEKNGTPLLQVEPTADKTLRLNVNTDVFASRTIKEINDMLSSTAINLANNLEEAVIHECGHAKSLKGKTLAEITIMYEEILQAKIENISKIAYLDGAEALAEIEVLLSRGEEVPDAAMEFYKRYMGDD